MRKCSLVLVATAGLLLATTGIASGAPRIPAPGGLPLIRLPATLVPPGFSTDAAQAVAAAKTSPTMQALHRREHPLFVVPYLWNGDPRYWFVAFFHGQKLVADVDVAPDGRVVAVWTGLLASALYGRGHYAPIFDSPWVLVPFSLLFLVPFLDPRRLRRLLHLDALVLLSFLGSYWLFDHGHLEAAVWLVYPPLLYLVARMLRVGLKAKSDARLAPLLSARTLLLGLVALTIARVVLSLVATRVVDVGFASLWGADRILSGLSPYTIMAGHADTYGPITYLAYAPFELIFGWNGTWTGLGAARAAALFFDLVTIVGLVGLGRRLRTGAEGTRLGLALGWAWAACPFTLLNLMMHSNDGLVAMLCVLSLLVFSWAPARGALLGLAAAAKFSPAALLPLYGSQPGKGRKSRLVCVLAFVLIVVTAIAVSLPSGGVSEFYRETIGYQLTRTDLFSAWGLHPTLAPVKLAFAAGAVLLALLVAFFPRGARRRSLAQVSALAAAVTIALQIPAVHWFYFYIVWFVPFVLVALLASAVRHDPEAPELMAEEWITAEAAHEPELATA